MTDRPALVPLSDRSAGMQCTRLLLAGVVVVFAASGGSTSEGPDLVVASGIHVAVTTAIEGARRLSGRRGLQALATALVADGLYLAAVVTATGGAGSGLLFLVHLHIVACALLMSFRSGIIAALGHGGLLVAIQGLPDELAVPTGGGRPALAAASFVLVGVAAVAFASLNERELVRSRRSSAALADLGTDLERCRREEEVVLAAAAHLSGRLGHERAAVLVEHGQAWSGACASGGVSVQVAVGAGGATAPVGPGDGVQLLPGFDERTAPLLEPLLPGARNVVLSDLVVDDRRVGVVAVECGPGRSRLRPDDLDVIEHSVARIALSIRTVRLLREVERLASSDPLTGLPNRRVFDSRLAAEVARSRRSGAPLSVALVDVDHFKAVNDGHGHAVGDEVLRQLADALRDATRQQDVVARYGGEEFVVLLPETDGEAATVVAERMRRAAGQVQRLPITISIGVASLGPDEGGRAVLGTADAALYQAKAAGRDRVVRWHPDTPLVLAP